MPWQMVEEGIQKAQRSCVQKWIYCIRKTAHQLIMLPKRAQRMQNGKKCAGERGTSITEKLSGAVF